MKSSRYSWILPSIIIGSTLLVGWRGSAATLYWDGSDTGANSTIDGGSGTWTTASTPANWRNETNTANVPWADANDAVFGVTPGTVTLGAAVSAANAQFSVSGYKVATSVSSQNLTITSTLTLAAGANLTFESAPESSNFTFSVGSFSGSNGSSLTLAGSPTAAAYSRLGLTGASASLAVPVTITNTGSNTGPIGIVATGSSGIAILSGLVTNHSNSFTLLGANDNKTLVVSGGVTGSAGVRFSSTSGSAGAGLVDITAATSFTGAALVNSNASGITKLSATGALATTSAVDIRSGSLLLAANNTIKDAAPVTLSGTSGKLALSPSVTGINETVGTLTLAASSTIDMGGVNGNILRFAKSSGITWTGTTLTLFSYNPTAAASQNAIYFGADETGLDPMQLSKITAHTGTTTASPSLGQMGLDSEGKLVPVPEPSPVLAASLLMGLAILRRQRSVGKSV